MQRKEVRVLRDNQGRIIGLVDGKMVYRFTLDSEDNIESYFVSLDTIPPTTIHNYDGLWHTSDITIVPSSSDDLSGVTEIFYRINNGPVRRVSVDGYPVITTEGANNTLEYWSIDNAGNEEPYKIITGIKLDKTPPTGFISINEGRRYTNATTVTLTLSANDEVSGVAEMRFSNDNVTWTSWEPYFTTKTWVLKPGDGLKKVYVQFRDHAGLVSQTYYSTITLDTTPPTIKAVIPEPSLQVYSTTLTVTYTGIDELSGIDHYEIRLDEGMWINMGTITSYTFKDLKAGSHTFYIKVIDKAGNINTTCTLFTIVTLTQTSTTTTTMTQTTPIITTTTMITTLTPVVTTTVTPTQTNMILITIIIAIIIWIALYYIIKHKITK
jgi:hypothetical protein